MFTCERRVVIRDYAGNVRAIERRESGANMTAGQGMPLAGRGHAKIGSLRASEAVYFNTS